jgi:hypothetical protein
LLLRAFFTCTQGCKCDRRIRHSLPLHFQEGGRRKTRPLCGCEDDRSGSPHIPPDENTRRAKLAIANYRCDDAGITTR